MIKDSKFQNNRILKLVLLLSILLLTLLVKSQFNNFEQKSLDQLFWLRDIFNKNPTISPLIYNISIDDNTYINSGSYNWDRENYSQILDKLSDSETDLIGCDIIFAGYTNERPDSLLIASIKNLRSMISPFEMKLSAINEMTSDERIKREKLIKYDLLPVAINLNTKQFYGIGVLPINEVVSISTGVGYVNIFPDNDGVIRKIPLVGIYNGKYIPSFALAVFNEFLECDFSKIEIFRNKIIVHKINNTTEIDIPIDDNGDFIINYYGQYSPINYLNSYSISNMLESDINVVKKQLKGRIGILSDISAVGKDLSKTPLENRFPTSFIYTTIISNLLNKDFLKPLSTVVNALILICILFIIYFLSIKFNIKYFIIFSIILLLIYLILVYVAFTYYGYIFPTYTIIIPTIVFFSLLLSMKIKTYNLKKTIPILTEFNFRFIDENSYREQLKSRWQEAKAGYENGAFRISVTLCGSIIEGLLSFSLQQIEDAAKERYFNKYIANEKSDKDIPDIDRWKIFQLIEVSKDMKIISKDSKNLSYIINLYRNLIHPEVEMREQIKINKNVIDATFNFLAIIYEDVEHFMKSYTVNTIKDSNKKD